MNYSGHTCSTDCNERWNSEWAPHSFWQVIEIIVFSRIPLEVAKVVNTPHFLDLHEDWQALEKENQWDAVSPHSYGSDLSDMAGVADLD